MEWLGGGGMEPSAVPKKRRIAGSLFSDPIDTDTMKSCAYLIMLNQHDHTVPEGDTTLTVRARQLVATGPTPVYSTATA